VLRRAWEASSAGKQHFVCIAGEPGIGKTRLLEEMLAWVGQQGFAAAYTRAYAAEGSLAFDPVAEWLRAESVRPRLHALEDVWKAEIARLLPELLSDRPSLPHPQPLAEGWQRRRFFEALARAFLVAPEPLLLALDDLQWCDQDTIEWLHYLLRFDPQSRLLVVGTYRPGEVDREHPLASLLQELRPTGVVTELELPPLEAGETAQLAGQLASSPLGPAEEAALHRLAEGNPLFIEEMLRSPLVGGRTEEMADGQLPSLAECSGLPARIQAITASRLARLSPAARDLAELAATVGRSFTFEVLSRADREGDDAVMAALDELWRRRIVRVQGEARYDFGHDLIREATYCSISPIRLRALHRRVAQALEQIRGADPGRASGEIAVHYERAGLTEQAMRHYQRAAEVAQRLSAYAEAMHILTKAQVLLAQLPDTPEREHQEFRLQMAISTSLRTLKGVTAPEVEAAYLRAYQLAERIGDESERVVALHGLYGTHLTRGEVKLAYELAQREFALAQGAQDASRIVDAHRSLGMALAHLGQWRASRNHLEHAVTSPDSLWPPTARLDDMAVAARRHLAVVLWHQGYPDQALIRVQEALALSQALDHPYTMVGALLWSSWLHRLRGKVSLAKAQAEKAISLSRQHGFIYRLAIGAVFEGWALTQGSELAAGLAEMQQGLAMLQNMDARLFQLECLSLLAEGFRRARQPLSGLRTIDEGLAIVEATGMRFAEAELCRLRGELLRLQGEEEPEIEACFLQALAVARQQGARSLELRAALSLGRLWQSQDRGAEAQALLSAIYNQFTEGWDTADLRAAWDLLAELAD
jgi:predicted ATPase